MEHDVPEPLDVPGAPGSSVEDGEQPPVGVEGRSNDMTVAVPTQTSRISLPLIAGFAVGAFTAWRVGLFSAYSSGLGLTALAIEDFRSRRVPKSTIDACAFLTLMYAALDASVNNRPHRLATAILTTMVVALVAGVIWYATSGIAFGDVKLLTLAAFVPAWIGHGALPLMIGVTLLASLGMVIFERVRNGPLHRRSTIAFGPPLLVGWLVGVLVT